MYCMVGCGIGHNEKVSIFSVHKVLIVGGLYTVCTVQ